MEKDKQLLQSESSAVRIDKNIASSIDMIWLDELGLSQEDKSLIKSILYYICVERQTNLFGYGSIDPTHFAKVMEYPEGYLRKPHADPIQLRNLNEEEKKERKRIEKMHPEKKIMDSMLENALYVLHTQTMQLRQGAKEVVLDDDGAVAKYVTLSKSYIFLPELKITMLKRRGEAKIKYDYTVDQRFNNNLSLYFLRFNKDAVIALRRSGKDDLYLHLKDLRDALLAKKQIGEIFNRSQNFEFLCSKGQIPFFKKNGEPKDNRIVKRELNDVLSMINEKTDLKFSVKWTKKQLKSRWNYEPHFYFSEVEDYNTKGIYRNIVVTREKREEKVAIFKENLLHELLATCRRYVDLSDIGDGVENLFFLWLISNRNINEKGLAFQNAQYLTFGSLHKEIEEMTKDWLASLESLQKLEDIIKRWEQYAEKMESKKEKFKNALSSQKTSTA